MAPPCDRYPGRAGRRPPAIRARRSTREHAATACRRLPVPPAPASYPPRHRRRRTLIRQILCIYDRAATPLTIRCPARLTTSAPLDPACSLSFPAFSVGDLDDDHRSRVRARTVLIVRGDANLFSIIGLSLRVSRTAVLLASLAAFPVGAVLAVDELPGRQALIVVPMRCAGYPPRRRGPGDLPAAGRARARSARSASCSRPRDGIAQAVLVFPRWRRSRASAVADAWRDYREHCSRSARRRCSHPSRCCTTCASRW